MPDQLVYSNVLLLDLGNTALKVVNVVEFQLGAVVTYAHANYEIDSLLDKILAEQGFTTLLFASVYRPEVSEQIKNWSVENQIECKQITTGKSYKTLKNGYQKPAQLGVDRWLTMIALWQKLQNEFAVVSVGSAVTFDRVDSNGQHLGGLIMPGITMMREALSQRTVAVKLDEQKAESLAFLQKNTTDAVASGTVLAVSGMIEKVMNELKMNYQKLVLTGGAANQVLPLLPASVVHHENLVLQGLRCFIGQERD